MKTSFVYKTTGGMMIRVFKINGVFDRAISDHLFPLGMVSGMRGKGGRIIDERRGLLEKDLVIWIFIPGIGSRLVIFIKDSHSVSSDQRCMTLCTRSFHFRFCL